MGKGVDRKFEECLKQRKITNLSSVKGLVDKELRVARGDLDAAQSGLKEKRWKWSTIQAYYTMFHTARALLPAIARNPIIASEWRWRRSL